jgi:hypothetical protein
MTNQTQWEKTTQLVPHPKVLELMSKLKQLNDLETKLMTEFKNALEKQAQEGDNGGTRS